MCDKLAVASLSVNLAQRLTIVVMTMTMMETMTIVRMTMMMMTIVRITTIFLTMITLMMINVHSDCDQVRRTHVIIIIIIIVGSFDVRGWAIWLLNHWFLSLWGLCGVTPSAKVGPGDVEGDDDGVVRGVFV